MLQNDDSFINKDIFVHYDSWNEIKIYCENFDNEIKNFKYKNMDFIILKNNNDMNFTIKNINKIEILKVLNDLPNNIDNLIINLDDNDDNNVKDNMVFNYIGGGLFHVIAYGMPDIIKDYDFLINAFTNLPITLKTLQIISSEIKDKKNICNDDFFINTLFRFLFSIKLPFDCELSLNYKDIKILVEITNGKILLTK